MPLSHPQGFDGRFLPYSVKFEMVDHNCKGCPYLKSHEVNPLEIVDDVINDRVVEIEYGCAYPQDISSFNKNIREPYLTISEIASNTCLFWDMYTKWKEEKVDAREGDWSDPLTTPKSLRFITDRDVETLFQSHYEMPVVTQTEIIPIMHFSEHCGILL